MIQPSRILNEKNGFLGLTYFDCAVLVMLTLQLHGFLAAYEKEWIALGVGPLIALSLIQIRIKYRRGIIASAIYFFLRRRLIRLPLFTKKSNFVRQALEHWVFAFKSGKKGEGNAS